MDMEFLSVVHHHDATVRQLNQLRTIYTSYQKQRHHVTAEMRQNFQMKQMEKERLTPRLLQFYYLRHDPLNTNQQEHIHRDYQSLAKRMNFEIPSGADQKTQSR